MRIGERQKRGWNGSGQRWSRSRTWGTEEGLQGALGRRRFGDRRYRLKESSNFTGRALRWRYSTVMIERCFSRSSWCRIYSVQHDVSDRRLLKQQTQRVPLVKSQAKSESFDSLIYLLMDASQVCLNLGSGGHPLSAEYAMRPKVLALRVLHILRKEHR